VIEVVWTLGLLALPTAVLYALLDRFLPRDPPGPPSARVG